MTKPNPGELRRHYKGDYYLVLSVGRMSEDRSAEYVAYYSLVKRVTWFRPLQMFVGDVEVDGKIVPRFALVPSDENVPLGLSLNLHAEAQRLRVENLQLRQLILECFKGTLSLADVESITTRDREPLIAPR